MFTPNDIEILESVLKDLKTTKGSDFSGVVVLEKAIRYLTANIQGTSMISANINSWIRVKLTEHGLDVFEHYIRSSIPPSLLERFGGFHKPDTDENGYSRFQMWQFMNIFGPHFIVGNADYVIDPLEIYIER